MRTCEANLIDTIDAHEFLGSAAATMPTRENPALRTCEQLVRDVFFNVEIESVTEDDPTADCYGSTIHVVACGRTPRTRQVLSCERTESAAWLAAAMLV